MQNASRFTKTRIQCVYVDAKSDCGFLERQFLIITEYCTQDPQWWYDDDENVIWAEETPKPSEGTDIGQSSARSIADRYLSAKYAKFSQQEFSRVSCLHITDPTEAGGFQVPYYQFDYFMIHGTGEDQREDLAYEIIINAYTKEIEYCSAASLGEGNG